jgi:septal ring factor EnvC (AmiA/AmiB activator)
LFSTFRFSFLLLFVLLAPVRADVDPARKEQVLQKLDVLQKDIQELKRSLSRVESRRRSILGEVQYLDMLSEKSRKELALIQSRLELASAEYKEKERIYAEKRKSVLQSTGYARGRMLDMYKYGNAGYFEVAFASADAGELIQNVIRMRYLLRKDATEIGKARDEMASLKSRMEEIRRTMQAIDSLKAEQQEKTNEIEQVRRDKSGRLRRINEEKNTYLDSLDELQKAALRLQKLMNDLGRPDLRQKITEMVKIPFSQYRGALNWPCEGDVVQQFGRSVDQKSRTLAFEKGIDIQGRLNDDVKCVYDGVVVYSDWFEGYGKLLIVNHGEDYYSIYAHLSDLLVRPDEKVSRWQTIGRLGDTGLLGGPRLHFEIRHKDRPEDPLAWLKRR